MHGVGNDFVVLDGISQRIDLAQIELRHIADRHFGVGCDQILVVERARAPGVDFRYRIFNADGGEVEQCGNGARCFVRFVRDKGLTMKREIRVETLSGVIAPRLEDDGRVTVDMGPPALEPARIPFDATGLAPLRDLPAASPLAAGVRRSRCGRSTSTAAPRTSSSCRWAIRTRCRWSPTSISRRSRPRARSSRATRASRSA